MKTKRMLSFLLALVLTFTLLPALSGTARAAETIPDYAVYVSTVQGLKNAVKVDGAYVVLEDDLQEYDTILVDITGDNVTLNLNGYYMRNTNPSP